MLHSSWLLPLLYTISCLVLGVALFVLRALFVIRRTHSSSRPRRQRSKDDTASLAIFLGSGGHTAEMMRLVEGVDWTRYSKRIYIVSSADTLSERKALSLEQRISSGSFSLLHIPRARHVHQSYLTSPFTTLYSLAYCFFHISLRPLLRPERVFADLILLNGPGSCVPIALSSFLPRILGLPSPSLIYIESLARTRRLSLSAILVRPLVDRFFVQWESLRDSLEKKGEGRWRMKAKVEFEGWLV